MEKKLYERLNNLEKELILELEKRTKDYTEKQIQENYYLARNKLNSWSSIPNMSREERFENWTMLETRYNFFAHKLEECLGWVSKYVHRIRDGNFNILLFMDKYGAVLVAQNEDGEKQFYYKDEEDYLKSIRGLN